LTIAAPPLMIRTLRRPSLDKTERLREILGLRRTPIKIGFLSEPPPGVERWTGAAAPAGCVFWAKAMEGKTFFTVPADHYNCAIGSYTHKIGLPAERANELDSTLGFMIETRYLDRAEIPAIPTLPETPAAIAYGPAGSSAFKGDVVLLALTPAQSTLIYEAALKAGVAQMSNAAFSRPSCAILPYSARQGLLALSFGCKGNRTFTGLPDDEMYISVPAAKWDEIVDRLLEVHRSNLTMGNYYQAHHAKFAKS
jgi:uncharacterized protein (DUF169 family)